MDHQHNLCTQCNGMYRSLGKHWSLSSSCDYREISKEEHEIITGCLMGDACIDRNSSKNPSFILVNTNKRYLEYIDNRLNNLTNGVSIHKTSQQSANSGEFGTRKESFSTIYRVKTVTHPDLKPYSKWYTNGKEFPDDLRLTGETLKHWFCCDGTYENSGSQDRIRISASNEIDNENKLCEYFSSIGLPEFSTMVTSDRSTGGKRCSLVWKSGDSRDLFNFMGKALPGFEYKWPKDLSDSR